MRRTDAFTTVDGIEIHHSEWGADTAPPVVCVHGLSRNGRDFDAIAAALSEQFRVLCPDLPGRGLSEWCADSSRYTNEATLELLVEWCDSLDLGSIRWIGTSMGAGLGMALAGGRFQDRIDKLVINDMCPDPATDADPEAIDRIATYVSNPSVVETVTDYESYLREIYEGRVSELSDSEWRQMAITSSRRTDDGRITADYDPAIVDGLVQATATDDAPDSWRVFDSITTDLCLIQGTESAICPPATFEKMVDHQPDAVTLQFECGHHPALNTTDQISPIRLFLSE